MNGTIGDHLAFPTSGFEANKTGTRRHVHGFHFSEWETDEYGVCKQHCSFFQMTSATKLVLVEGPWD